MSSSSSTLRILLMCLPFLEEQRFVESFSVLTLPRPSVSSKSNKSKVLQNGFLPIGPQRSIAIRQIALMEASKSEVEDHDNNSISKGTKEMEYEEEEVKSWKVAKEEDCRIHETIRSQDPEWYREYVINILGEDFCKTTWPTPPSLPAITDISQEHVEETTGTDSPTEETKEAVIGDASTNQTASGISFRKASTATTDDTLRTINAKTKPSLPDSEENNKMSLAPLVSDESAKTAFRLESSMREERKVGSSMRSLTLENGVSDFGPKNTMEKEETTKSSPLVQINASTQVADVEDYDGQNKSNGLAESSEPPLIQVDRQKVDVPSDDKSTKSKSMPTNISEVPSIQGEEPENLLSSVSTQDKLESDIQDQRQITGSGDSFKNDSVIVNITEIPRSDVSDSANKTAIENQSQPMQSALSMVIYRDAREGWKSIALSTLTKLGYRSDELCELQSDAVAVIVQDAIPRPRMLGLPRAWKLDPGQTPIVQVAQSPTKAQALIENLTLMEKAEEKNWKKRRSTSRPPKKFSTKDEQNMEATLPSRDNKTFERTASTTDEINEMKQIEDEESGFVENGIEQGMGASDSLETKTNSDAVRNKDEEEAMKSREALVSELLEGRAGGGTTSILGDPTLLDGIQQTGAKEEVDDKRSEECKEVVLYRNIANLLASVPLQDLTKLGYQLEEVLSLKSEALAVIVEDQAPRPRIGIPPQWISDRGPEVEIVDSIEEVESRLEADISERRRKSRQKSSTLQQRELEEFVGSNAKNSDYEEDSEKRQQRNASKSNSGERRADERVTSGSSRRESPRQEINDFSRNRRPRPSSQNLEEMPRKRDSRSRSADTPKRNSRRESRRSNRNDDGSPKRIYNAREQLNQRKATPRADPPDPDSPIWMNIDSFRDLLRSEAELRLRILGDDWAPTVKQESEWRLNLYKDWLWTLHNGVGDSIVPPSRYERARKSRELKQREEGEPKSPARRRRTPRDESSRSSNEKRRNRAQK